MVLKSSRVKLKSKNKNGDALPREFEIVGRDNYTIGATSFVEAGRDVPEFQIIIFDEKNRHQGIGSEVIDLMIEYGFESLDYDEIELYVFPFEKNAINVYLKNGFRIRRIMHQSHYNDEKYKTIFVMGITKEERKGF
ncbi:MAG: GNAT family N-acetyltransferase [Kosmotoga sp.]|nr:MAG: GNAT family N-acetyltransferase [Kosmotoga sp.]